MDRICFMRRRAGLAALLSSALLAGIVALSPPAAQAQPFGAWLLYSGNLTANNGYVQVTSSPDLNPTDVLTLEGWFQLSSSPGNCISLIGKNWQSSYWVGVCPVSGQLLLRSYLRGGLPSQKNGGIVTVGEWTHFAVTFDGATRKHYLNGELVASFADAGPLPTDSDPVEIGSDVHWAYSPNGSLNEFRLWHTARTVSQIRSTINVPLTAAQPGLVAVWQLRFNGNDALGAHSGTLHGTVNPFTFPAILHCAGNATTLCLDDRFAVSIQYRVGAPGTATGTGQVAPCGTADSGLFWFFDPSNWEVLVKEVNGCGLNSERWIFSASTTNVYYKMTVIDVRGSGAKIYFNYPGPPAPAVTDTSAFATCP